MEVDKCIDTALQMHRITPSSCFMKPPHLDAKAGQHPEDQFCHVSWQDVALHLTSYTLLFDIRPRRQ
jgi:hypothetical protein